MDVMKNELKYIAGLGPIGILLEGLKSYRARPKVVFLIQLTLAILAMRLDCFVLSSLPGPPNLNGGSPGGAHVPLFPLLCLFEVLVFPLLMLLTTYKKNYEVFLDPRLEEFTSLYSLLDLRLAEFSSLSSLELYDARQHNPTTKSQKLLKLEIVEKLVKGKMTIAQLFYLVSVVLVFIQVVIGNYVMYQILKRKFPA